MLCPGTGHNYFCLVNVSVTFLNYTCRRIRDVQMQIATPDGDGERVTSVEKCQCPLGYSGLSCERCADGYYRYLRIL